MYFKLKVYSPETDLYCYDYVVTDTSNDRHWETIGEYANRFVEFAGCVVESVEKCTNEEINFVMENTKEVRDYFQHGLQCKQMFTDEDWFLEV